MYRGASELIRQAGQHLLGRLCTTHVAAGCSMHGLGLGDGRAAHMILMGSKEQQGRCCYLYTSNTQGADGLGPSSSGQRTPRFHPNIRGCAVRTYVVPTGTRICAECGFVLPYKWPAWACPVQQGHGAAAVLRTGSVPWSCWGEQAPAIQRTTRAYVFPSPSMCVTLALPRYMTRAQRPGGSWVPGGKLARCLAVHLERKDPTGPGFPYFLKHGPSFLYCEV